MLPLKIAFLWHHHQPWYKSGGEFILPWTRFHGVKDYLDLALILSDNPDIRQTFNLVPSMLVPLDEYISGETEDKIQKLTKINASLLTETDKIAILDSFFICNIDNMIIPYPRYRELYEKARVKKIALSEFITQDWLDLQVWYNLSWIGPISRENPEIEHYFQKGENFTENEKFRLLDLHLEILKQITPALKNLQGRGQIEISCSPFYHPILPLLCNSDVVLEAMSGTDSPNPAFKFPQDAVYHIEESVKYYKNIFGKNPDGMWPSEGSISNESLNLISKAGIKWVATDEEILHQSMKVPYNRLERFFPRKYLFVDEKTSNIRKTLDVSTIIIFFRDHLLSDLIGFSYPRWDAKEAATDFVNRLKYVRWELTTAYGEDCLHHAVIPIILDGENCWEFYKDNGKPFLDELYRQLSNDEQLKTVTFNETIKSESINYMPSLNNLRAGSWINADFGVWLGQKEHKTAWEMLQKARQIIYDLRFTIYDVKSSKENQNEGNGLNPLNDGINYQLSIINSKLNEALKEIYIAEGSDWFWWYCDSHQAPNKKDFDIMFRKHLSRVYEILGLEVPDELTKPIGQDEKISFKQSQKQITLVKPVIPEIISWQYAGYFDCESAMDAMHAAGEFLKKAWFGNDEKSCYFRLEFNRKLNEDDQIELIINDVNSILISKMNFQINTVNEINNLIFTGYNHKHLSVDYKFVAPDFEDSYNLLIKTKNKSGEIYYPRQGKLEINLV